MTLISLRRDRTPQIVAILLKHQEERKENIVFLGLMVEKQKKTMNVIFERKWLRMNKQIKKLMH